MARNQFYVGSVKRLTLAVLCLLVSHASAQLATGFNFDGVLLDNSNNPITGSQNINFKIMDSSGTCILFEENHTGVTLASDGSFSLRVGTGSVAFLPGSGWASIFQNTTSISTGSGTCGGTYAPTGGSARKLRITVGATQLSDFDLYPVPMASNSQSLQGKVPGDFLQVRDDVSYDLNQANLENIFSATNYANLAALVSGSSTQYVSSTPGAAVGFNNQKLISVADPTAAQDAATKNYSDGNIGGKIALTTGVGPASGDGFTLIWDQASNRWTTGSPSATDSTKLPLTGGTMTGAITMGGNNILSTGHVTMSPQMTLNLGTYTSAQEATLTGGLAGADAGKIWYNSTSGSLIYWNGSATQTVSTAGGGGTVSSVVTGTGLLGGPITTSGTLSIDVGTTANKIVQLDGTGKLPAVDGSLLQNVIPVGTVMQDGNSLGVAMTVGTNDAQDFNIETNAAKRLTVNAGSGSVGIGTTAPVGKLDVKGTIFISGSTSGYVGFAVPAVAGSSIYTWPTADGTSGFVLSTDGAGTLSWVAQAGGGSVSAIYAGTGLVGGPITNSGTLSIDVGTTANRIVQLDGSGKLPAVDGSQLTNLAIGGTVTNLYLGSGMVGMGTTITNTGTLSVNIGTMANQVVALDGLSRLPSVDGSMLTNVNATSINGYPIAAIAPSAGQALVWNSTSGTWGPETLGGGTVTNLYLGSGMVGSGTTITASGTIAVNVGTFANSVVQLDGSGRLPSVDGSQLTNLAAAGVVMHNGNLGALTVGTNNTGNLDFETNGSVRMTIHGTSGNVGIGVTPSSVALSVGTGSINAAEICDEVNANCIDLSLGTAVSAITALSGDVTATGPGSATAVIGNNAVTSAKINSTGIATNRLLITDATTGSSVTYSTCAVDEILKWTASGWGCSTVLSTGALMTSGGNGMTVPLLVMSSSTAVAPAIAPSGDTDTGLFFPAADTVGVAIGSVEQMRITSTGNVGLGTAAPSTKLHVMGAIRVDAGGTCTAGLSGAIQYNSGTSSIEYCNGTQWLAVAPPPPAVSIVGTTSMGAGTVWTSTISTISGATTSDVCACSPTSAPTAAGLSWGCVSGTGGVYLHMSCASGGGGCTGTNQTYYCRLIR